jgi:hypothetical protein
MPSPVSRREPITDPSEARASSAPTEAIDRIEAFPSLHRTWTRCFDLLQGPKEAVRALRPGDSARLSAGGEVDVAGLAYAGRFSVDISRDEDGTFRVGFESEAGAGFELDFGSRSRVDGTTNGKLRLEYRFSSADDAMLAASSVLITQGRSVVALGRPSAIEGEVSTIVEVMTELGIKKLSAAETRLAAGDATSARLELDGPQLELVLKSSFASESSASLGAGLTGSERWGFLNLGEGAAAQTRLEVEHRIPLGGDATTARPLHKATLFTQSRTAGATVEREVSVELSLDAALAFAGGVAEGKTAEALLTLSTQVGVEAKEAHFTRTEHHYGGAMQLKVLGGGAELTVETRKRTGGN